MKIVWVIFLIISFLQTGFADLKTAAHQLSLAEMQAVCEFLGHDLLEGRAPGTRGGDISEIYMKSLFKFMGLQPENGDYFQTIPMIGIYTENLTAAVKDTTLHYLHDVVGVYTGPSNQFTLEGELVFAGFGIRSALWKWDDFKKTDVKGKIIICRVNDPGLFNPMIFLGKTLTYYGRWTYHIEEAIRQGALGILLIHTNETAGYNWQVVQNSWSGEQLYLQNDLDNSLFFRGWIKEESLQALLAGQKYNLEKLYQLANKKSFKPIPLKLAIKINGHKQQRNFTCNNVIGHLPGKVDKRIVLSAHIDHFGIDRRKDDGDNIFNGAIDNASAVAAMAVCAKLLKNLQKDLYYSVTFLACQVEEAGLLGSKYYVQHTNRENIIANLNFESTPVWGKTNSIMGVGAEYNQFESILRSIAQELNIEYTTSSLVDQGFFYRSDQFPFARYRIPAIWISTGDNDSAASQSYREFWRTRYHTVKDEYDPAWTFEGLRETVHYTLMIIDRLNTEKKPIQWNPSLPFPFEE